MQGDISKRTLLKSHIPIDLTGLYEYPFILNKSPIHVYEEWAETLNPANGSTRVLESLLEYGILNEPDINRFKSGYNDPQSPLEAIVEQLLTKSVANGLSRIGAQYGVRVPLASGITDFAILPSEIVICSDNWCSQGPLFLRAYMPLIAVSNGSRDVIAFQFGNGMLSGDPYYSWTNDSGPIMQSFAKPVDADTNWTRLQFPYHKYGRAYALDGVASYLAAGLLCFHAAIALAHVAYRILVDYQVFDFGGSLGELLVLAMGDSAPIGNGGWAQNVVLARFTDAAEADKLKLVAAADEPDVILEQDP
jgi:hypothetical protein